ncbi:MAG: type IV pili twitching motility protein PilT, partial [Planctomycetota bacterium]
MAVSIEKLLDLAYSKGASDIHLEVDRPPTLRINGRLKTINTPPLTPDDTLNLMKSITSERCQQELAERGGSDFGFAYGEKARFRVSILKKKGHV